MLLNCCYRLQKYGEIIHSVWDTSKLEIEGMPKSFFDINSLRLPDKNGYSHLNYANAKTDFKKACEAILMSNDDYVIVMECCNIFYICVTIFGEQFNVKAPTEEPLAQCQCGVPACEDYKNIGYRVTVPIQVRESAGVYRLTYSKSENVVYTNDGVLKVGFDVSKLLRPDFSYAGYKAMVEDGAYAVVYFEDGYKYVYRENDTLVLKN